MVRYSDQRQADVEADLALKMSLGEAKELCRTMQDYFDHNEKVINVAVLWDSVEERWVCHAIVKSNYPTEEDVGDNQMVVLNKIMWDMIR